MTLSKKAIRPAQTSFLLANGVLPISLDYRLCPEINLIDGPIADIRDANSWAQTDLQAVVRSKGITIDVEKVVFIGWSTGGHLAMTTAWTTEETGIKPPRAILSFYGPTDFESGGEFPSIRVQDRAALTSADLDVRRAEMYPERKMSMDNIVNSLPTRPVCSLIQTTTPSS